MNSLLISSGDAELLTEALDQYLVRHENFITGDHSTADVHTHKYRIDDIKTLLKALLKLLAKEK